MTETQITITKNQKFRFKEVLNFVKEEKPFKNKRVKQSDAFELLLQLFQSARDSGMMPNE